MSATAIIIESPDLAKFQEDVVQQFGPVGLRSALQAMGGAVRNQLIEHFTALEQDSVHHRTSSRLLAARTGFYSDAARSVQTPRLEGDNAVAIGINKEG